MQFQHSKICLTIFKQQAISVLRDFQKSIEGFLMTFEEILQKTLEQFLKLLGVQKLLSESWRTFECQKNA